MKSDSTLVQLYYFKEYYGLYVLMRSIPLVLYGLPAVECWIFPLDIGFLLSYFDVTFCEQLTNHAGMADFWGLAQSVVV